MIKLKKVELSISEKVEKNVMLKTGKIDKLVFNTSLSCFLYGKELKRVEKYKYGYNITTIENIIKHQKLFVYQNFKYKIFSPCYDLLKVEYFSHKNNIEKLEKTVYYKVMEV